MSLGTSLGESCEYLFVLNLLFVRLGKVEFTTRVRTPVLNVSSIVSISYSMGSKRLQVLQVEQQIILQFKIISKIQKIFINKLIPSDSKITPFRLSIRVMLRGVQGVLL